MGAHMLAADGEDHARLGTVGDCNQDRGGNRSAVAKLGQVSFDRRLRRLGQERGPQPLGQRHPVASSVKNAPSLHTPGGSEPSARPISTSS